VRALIVVMRTTWATRKRTGRATFASWAGGTRGSHTTLVFRWVTPCEPSICSSTPVLAQLYGATAVAVNFGASLPGAAHALLNGKLNSRVPATILIAACAFIPGVTSGLNRFGVTWSFFLGEFLGVLLIFAGFLVSEEVFRNIRLGGTLWSRTPSDGALATDAAAQRR
jgi:hypothetical protein